mmetsp:Transcript_98581/g.155799  ORF Transcript_98581/g.155799 Transcript_98581/m.155799 type:complete len:268 (+) Transcript_98581:483-1286(+)
MANRRSSVSLSSVEPSFCVVNRFFTGLSPFLFGVFFALLGVSMCVRLLKWIRSRKFTFPLPDGSSSSTSPAPRGPILLISSCPSLYAVTVSRASRSPDKARVTESPLLPTMQEQYRSRRLGFFQMLAAQRKVRRRTKATTKKITKISEVDAPFVPSSVGGGVGSGATVASTGAVVESTCVRDMLGKCETLAESNSCVNRSQNAVESMSLIVLKASLYSKTRTSYSVLFMFPSRGTLAYIKKVADITPGPAEVSVTFTSVDWLCGGTM